MVEIGERWQVHQINVVAEHFASQFMRRKLATLLNVFEGARGVRQSLWAARPMNSMISARYWLPCF